ncbi:DNA-binding protein [Chitinophagaceae bacterium IBVUCB1]|nr:DNA-binding protein [Chitinophagaceae bacterium IBVUCB1]
MNVICLEEPALFQLVEIVVARLQSSNGQEYKKWIPPSEAMQLLNLKSKTSLQALRDTGKIRFSQPQKKVILYDRDSIITYLEKNAQNTF